MAGTVILCDKVYTTQNGQYVIAGTWTQFTAVVPSLDRAEWHFQTGINLYVRFRPERAGGSTVTIAIKDERREVWDQSWLRNEMQISIPEGMPRLVEMAITTPPFRITLGPAEPGRKGRIVVASAIELSVDGQLAATTPFDLIFVTREERPPVP